MNKLFPKINWISFDKNNPPKDIPPDTECLIFLREKYAEEWEYSVDIAIPYGKYLDDFWNTNVDWKEGQNVEVLAYAQLPYAQKESELIKVETTVTDAIDEYRELLKNYFVIPHDLRVIDMYAEQLKEKNNE